MVQPRKTNGSSPPLGKHWPKRTKDSSSSSVYKYPRERGMVVDSIDRQQDDLGISVSLPQSPPSPPAHSSSHSPTTNRVNPETLWSHRPLTHLLISSSSSSSKQRQQQHLSIGVSIPFTTTTTTTTSSSRAHNDGFSLSAVRRLPESAITVDVDAAEASISASL